MADVGKLPLIRAAGRHWPPQVTAAPRSWVEYLLRICRDGPQLMKRCRSLAVLNSLDREHFASKAAIGMTREINEQLVSVFSATRRPGTAVGVNRREHMHKMRATDTAAAGIVARCGRRTTSTSVVMSQRFRS